MSPREQGCLVAGGAVAFIRFSPGRNVGAGSETLARNGIATRTSG